MLGTVLLGMALGPWTTAEAAARPKGDGSLPPIALATYDYVFPTGLRVMLLPDDSQPVVTIATIHDAGSADEPEDQAGLAHLVEHLWFRSTYADLPQVRDVQAQLGCWDNASTTFEVTDYVTTCPTSALDAVLRLESLRLTNPLAGVTEAGFATERETVRNELRMRTENRWWTAQSVVLPMLYPAEHPYARPVIGSHESLDRTTLAGAVAFARDGYTPDNTTLVINGDIDPQRIPEVLFTNMDLTLFHPDLTPELVRKWPRPAIPSPDANNPDHWYVWPADPNNPVQPLPLGKPRRRAPAKAPNPPPVVRSEPVTAQVAVARPLTVMAWSLPGVTGPEAARYSTIAWRTSKAIQRAMPEDADITSSCSVQPGRSGSTLYCFIEVPRGVDRDALVAKAKRWLEASWEPSKESTSVAAQHRSRARRIHSEVVQMEVVAGLWDSRAARTAHHAHLTGRSTYFRDTLEGILTANPEAERTLAYEWIRPERTVVAHLDPLPRAELFEVSASRAHSRSNTPTAAGIDPTAITPDIIRAATVVPDPDRVRTKTLDNGLTVVAMQHGSTPWVRSQLVFRKGPDRDFDRAAERAQRERAERPLDFGAFWLQGTGADSRTMSVVSPAEQLDGALWLLDYRLRQRYVDQVDWEEYYRSSRKRLSAQIQRPSWWAAYTATQLVFPDSQTHAVLDWDTHEQRTISRKALVAYLDQKYQPTNAALVIVGDIDPDTAIARAEHYLGKWKADGEAFPPLATHTPAQTQQVLVFDNPRATQTTVQLRCALPHTTPDDWAANSAMRALLKDRLFTSLRGRDGVTYGVSVSTSSHLNGDASLRVTTRVETTAAAGATTTIQAAITDLASGSLSEDAVRTQAYVSGLRSVLSTQTTADMVHTLSRSWEYNQPRGTFAERPDRLAALSAATVSGRLAGCTDHQVVTLEGPVDVLMPQLEAAGIAATEFDWRAATQTRLEAWDPTEAKHFEARQAAQSEGR